MTIKRRKEKSLSLFYTSDPHLTDSRLWGTRWPQRRATWRRRPWRRQRANSASWDPPVWWRCRSGSGTSPACCHAARYSARSSPRSAASCAAPGLEERRGPRKASRTRERRSKSEEKNLWLRECCIQGSFTLVPLYTQYTHSKPLGKLDRLVKSWHFYSA